MDNYRKKIKNRIALFGIVVVLAVGAGIYDVFIMDTAKSDNIIISFQFGLIVGASLLALIKIIQYSKVLKDEKNLSIEYNKENDERSKAIRAKAGMPMLMITSVLIIIGGIVAGYFNEVIFITLAITAISQLMIGIIVKFYYMKKM